MSLPRSEATTGFFEINGQANYGLLGHAALYPDHRLCQSTPTFGTRVEGDLHTWK